MLVPYDDTFVFVYDVMIPPLPLAGRKYPDWIDGLDKGIKEKEKRTKSAVMFAYK